MFANNRKEMCPSFQQSFVEEESLRDELKRLRGRLNLD